MSSTATQPIRWNLSALFASIDDPKIEETWGQVHEHADRFVENYRGRLNVPGVTAGTLANAIADYESLNQLAAKPILYANLIFAADTSKPEHGAILQEQSERATELNVKLMFFELELQEMPEDQFKLLRQDPALTQYGHFLDILRVYSPYRLTESEEVILEETANTGVRAWVRLFEEMTGNHVFHYHNPLTGDTEELSESEVLDRLRDPDRNVRIAAADTLSAGLKDMERVLVFAFNTLLQDKKTGDRLRGHEYAEHSRHLSNELTKEIVDMVVGLCVENYKIVERYYLVKKKLLGLEELTHVDRYAPIHEAKATMTWEQSRQVIVEAFTKFHPTIGKCADEFFENDWIDAEPRKGKSGGAFCSSNTPDTHPVILMTYLNKADDCTTLAHELGHGVHGSLARKQTYLNFHGTLPLAELASIFGEILVFEDLVKDASLQDKIALYAEKIEGIFASSFRQVALFKFEKAAHERRRDEGELTAEEFGELWQENVQAMFGSSVKLGEQHRCWWSYISHFFAVPFYVYAYAFGELLTLSLYEQAKQEGAPFAEKYVELLSSGGNGTPQELMNIVGVDLSSEDFWRGGFRVIEKMVATFEALVEQQR